MRFNGTTVSLKIRNLLNTRRVLEYLAEVGVDVDVSKNNATLLSEGSVVPLDLRIDGQPVNLLLNQDDDGFVLRSATLSFTTPVLERGGQAARRASFSLTSTTSSVPFQWMRPDFIYLVDSCFEEGEFLDVTTNTCLKCPPGAYCPGGARAFPAAGRWSVDEASPPGECTIAEACLGGLNINDFRQDGSRETSKCNERYGNDYCSRCEEGHFRDGNRCVSCQSQAQKPLLLLITVVSITVLIAIATVVLKDKHLDIVIAMIVATQQLLLVLRGVAEQIFGDEQKQGVKSFLRVLSSLALDINAAAPECLGEGRGLWSFGVIYTATLLYMATLLLAVVLAAKLRSCPNLYCMTIEARDAIKVCSCF
ncbi:MAG: hypothetical protein MHM6MM_001287 [Cercozoa sp. M6MM]